MEKEENNYYNGTIERPDGTTFTQILRVKKNESPFSAFVNYAKSCGKGYYCPKGSIYKVSTYDYENRRF